VPVRVAAISFLNPAPLLFDFEHEPTAAALRAHYQLHYTTPANCARELHTGNADLGLIPIAELTPELAIVPGCAIAALHEVRSILLLVKNPGHLPVDEALRQIRSIAADRASRSSTAYLHVLLQRFYNARPEFTEYPADPLAMLADADAALLIGDPALLAREHRSAIEAQLHTISGAPEESPLLWIDLAALWRRHTNLPWVAAVWAVRPEALTLDGLAPEQLIADLTTSRDHGLEAIDSLVREWTPRIALPPATIHTYLTHNIHYVLDAGCLAAIEHFRSLAAELRILPSLPQLNLLK
jgi:chorismate dehydratase